MAESLTVNEKTIIGLIEKFYNFVNFKNRTNLSIDFQNKKGFLYLEEGYKYEIAEKAKKALCLKMWNSSMIGTGKIGKYVSDAVSCAENLINFHQIIAFKNKCNPNHSDYNIDVEKVLFDIYANEKISEEKAFENAIDVFGAKYNLLAYLFFIKNPEKFLPISPSNFDKCFNSLGIDLKTTRNCSWNNYCEFIGIIESVRQYLDVWLPNKNEGFTLIDAHSFLWIIQQEQFKTWNITELKNVEIQPVKEYLGKERSVTANARAHQDIFRKRLIEKYGKCCICEISKETLLLASHIKPWCDSSPVEKTDVNNGLLLCPNHDKLFDSGLISFDENGSILISSELNKKEYELLNLSPSIQIELEDNMKPYMCYHREKIFRK